MIQAQFSGEKITSNSVGAFSLYEKSRFGEKKQGKVEYSTVEALFLVQKNKMKVFSGKKEISESTLLRKIRRKDKKIETKLTIFKDLRKKGYILKTALKFGADFRVYGKGIKPGEDHAKWIVFATRESDSINWNDFAGKSRIAHSTKKKLLIGVVDEEDSVTYYEISWIKP